MGRTAMFRYQCLKHSRIRFDDVPIPGFLSRLYDFGSRRKNRYRRLFQHLNLCNSARQENTYINRAYLMITGHQHLTRYDILSDRAHMLP